MNNDINNNLIELYKMILDFDRQQIKLYPNNKQLRLGKKQTFLRLLTLKHIKKYNR